MTGHGPPDEEALGRLIGMLEPAPPAWVRAAQELPAARLELDDVVARAEADAAFREALVRDLEDALARARLVAEPAVVEALRQRFPAP